MFAYRARSEESPPSSRHSCGRSPTHATRLSSWLTRSRGAAAMLEIVEREDAAQHATNCGAILAYTFLASAARALWSGDTLSAFIYLLTNSTTAVGVSTGVRGIAQIAVAPLAGWAADRLPRHLLLRFGSCIGLVAACLSAVAIFSRQYGTLCVALLVWGVSWAVVNPAVDALFADSLSLGERSRYFTRKAQLRQLGGAVGPAASLVIFVVFGDQWTVRTCQVAVLIGCALTLIPTAMLWLLRDLRATSEPVNARSAHAVLAQPLLVNTCQAETGRADTGSTLPRSRANSLRSNSRAHSVSAEISAPPPFPPPPPPTSTQPQSLTPPQPQLQLRPLLQPLPQPQPPSPSQPPLQGPSARSRPLAAAQRRFAANSTAAKPSSACPNSPTTTSTSNSSSNNSNRSSNSNSSNSSNSNNSSSNPTGESAANKTASDSPPISRAQPPPLSRAHSNPPVGGSQLPSAPTHSSPAPPITRPSPLPRPRLTAVSALASLAGANTSESSSSSSESERQPSLAPPSPPAPPPPRRKCSTHPAQESTRNLPLPASEGAERGAAEGREGGGRRGDAEGLSTSASLPLLPAAVRHESSLPPLSPLPLLPPLPPLRPPLPRPAAQPHPVRRHKLRPDSTCCGGRLLLVPSLVLLYDVIGALASGMSICFFPIFFLRELRLSPVAVCAISLAASLAVVLGGGVAVALAKRLGRVPAVAVLRLGGCACFLLMTARTLLILVAYLLRTTLMNCTGGVTKSILHDLVPPDQRARYAAVDTISTGTWAGSAALGGFLIDRYGIAATFHVTAVAQAVALFPLL
ncbi:hypothetical protein T492DRAFT_618225, partial [Pavlovales sp. CCMP2436]